MPGLRAEEGGMDGEPVRGVHEEAEEEAVSPREADTAPRAVCLAALRAVGG